MLVEKVRRNIDKVWMWLLVYALVMVVAGVLGIYVIGGLLG